MTPTIDISEIDSFPVAKFLVVVDDSVRTEHVVTLKEDDFERLRGNRSEPTELVNDAFLFLLEREPNTSILSSFDLTLINTYFPEFESVITSK